MDGAGIGLTANESVDAYAKIRASGHSLAYAKVRLDRFRESPLDRPFLGELEAAFDRVRQAGIKVVLRFVYNDDENGADAPASRVIEHVHSLAPVLQANKDAIAVIQAGFIGHWGEWHGSTNALDAASTRGNILRALVESFPSSRAVQVRKPIFKFELAEPRFVERIGHHNDCFLASDTDQGTFDPPVDANKDKLALDSARAIVGGETCRVNPPRTDCASALAELQRFHFSYLNDGYHPDVITAWAKEGCKDEVARRLGHRFELVTVTWSEKTQPSGTVHVRITLRNTGFARLMNERKPIVLVDDGSARHAAAVPFDLRSIDPGAEMSFDAAVPLRNARIGRARLILRMPDPEERLRDRAEYALRCANDKVWDAVRGENVLTDNVVIAAP